MSVHSESRANFNRAEYSCLCQPGPNRPYAQNYAGQVGQPYPAYSYNRTAPLHVKKPPQFTKREKLLLILLIFIIIATIAAVIGMYFLYDPVKYHYGSKESAKDEKRRKRDIQMDKVSVNDEINSDEVKRDGWINGVLENKYKKEIKTEGSDLPFKTKSDEIDKLTTNVSLIQNINNNEEITNLTANVNKNITDRLEDSKEIYDLTTNSFIPEFDELTDKEQTSIVSVDENTYGENKSSLQQRIELSSDQDSGIASTTPGMPKLIADEQRSVTEKYNSNTESYQEEKTEKNDYKNGSNVEWSETNEIRWSERDLCNCSQINMYKTPKGCIPLKKYSTEIIDTTTLISNFPYMVSITSRAFEDDSTEVVFRCSGVILGTRLVLTGTACVLKTSDWRNLLIRSGSDYWSTGGSVHTVTKYFEGPGNLIALEVTPDFVYSNFVSEIKIIEPTSKKISWRRGLSPGWMYPDNYIFSHRRKFTAITYTRISPKKCLFDSTETDGTDCSNICPFTAGHPLIVDSILVGIRGGEHCDVTNITFDNVDGFDKLFFTDMQSKQIISWLQHIKVLFQYTDDEQEENLHKVKHPVNTHRTHFGLKEKEESNFGFKETEDSSFDLKERENPIQNVGVQTNLQDTDVKKFSELLEMYINLKNKETSTPKMEQVKEKEQKEEDIASKKLEKIESDIHRLLKVLEKQFNIHNKNTSVSDSQIVRIGTLKNVTTDKRNINENQTKSIENIFTNNTTIEQNNKNVND